MRIQANYFSYSPVQKKNTNFRPVQNKVSTPVVDTFVSKNVSFGDSYEELVVYNKFDPLNGFDTELDNMAVILNDKSVDDVEALIEERYKVGFLTSNTKEKRCVAKDRLIPRLKKVHEDKRKCMEIVNNLTKKELAGDSNIVSQKLNLKQKYLGPLSRMVAGNQDISVANGILVYGKADDKAKNNFTQWLFEEAAQMGVSAVKVDFSAQNPQESFKKLNSALENSKRYNKMTGLHTITFVDGIDRLLTDVKNDEAFDYIDDFKTMVENAAKNYHTTFVVQTNMPLEDFDSASIGNQRFNLKLNLNNGITEEEKAALRSAKNKLDYYKEQSNHTDIYYGWVTRYVNDDWGPGNPAFDIGR